MKLTVGSLFSGIGGLEVGLEKTGGFETVWQVECDEYARSVLERHWPKVRRFNDVTQFVPDETCACDVLTGGFPCQDISVAGKGQGLEGERSGLWHEFARIIRYLLPRFVIVENVPALLVRGMGVVLGDLAECGYDAEWAVLQARDFGLPHRRQRVFIVAYPNGFYGETRVGIESERAPQIFRENPTGSIPVRVQAEYQGFRENDGIPSRLYESRGRAVGNAVAPAMAEWVGWQIRMSLARTENTG